jgi:uridine kinase
MYALTVYVDSTAQERLARLLTRDPIERARPRRAVERHFWEHVEPMHQRFVAPHRDAADLVVQAPVSAAVLHRLVRRMNALIDAPTLEVA